jgi:hypothetical protein
VYHKQWLADLGFVFQMEEVDEKELQRLDNYLRM